MSVRLLIFGLGSALFSHTDVGVFHRIPAIACTTKALYLKPEDQRTFQEMIERDGYMVDYEVYFRQKDGKRIYCNDYEKGQIKDRSWAKRGGRFLGNRIPAQGKWI